MSIDELIIEYERIMNIKLTERDITIFRYAYFVGKNNLDKREEND